MFKMANAPKTKVYLLKHSGDFDAKPAAFEQCCLTYLGCQGDKMSMNVGIVEKDGRLEIYPSEQGLRLEHPAGCPCCFLTPSDIASITSSDKTRGVVVGVSVILQSSDNHVLITRRAKHMRTFPSVWVAPGGHLEPGESINQACLRELREETGLHFTEEHVDFTTLGLWESVYPAIISMGLPIRHHIVVYLLAIVKDDLQTLQQRVKMQQDEVDAVTWLDTYIATEIAASDEAGQKTTQSRYFKALVQENNGTKETSLPLSILMRVLPSQPIDCVRLSSGTKFALSQWLKFLHPH